MLGAHFFYQVSEEEITRAQTLAGMLEIALPHAIGMALVVKRAAIRVSGTSGTIPGDPAAWCAAQVGWPQNDARRLLDALLCAGHVLAIAGPSPGHTVAFLGPLQAMEETSKKRSEAGKKGAETRKSRGGYGPAMARPQPGDSHGMARDGKKETETETLKTTSSPAAIAEAAKAIESGGTFPTKQTAIPGTDEPAPVVSKKPTTSAAEFAGWAREAAKPLLAPDAPDSSKLRGDQWSRLGEALKAHGTLKMQAAFRLYTGDPHWLGKGLPLGAFVADWERWVAQVTAPRPPAAAQRPAQKASGMDFAEMKRRAAEVAAQEAREAAEREEGRNGTPAGP